MDNDDRFMWEAIREAKRAQKLAEVPIGAVVVRDGEIVARGHNLRESTGDPTAHAEMIAVREASRKLGGWRLIGCTIYVTLEPCPMCAGALIQARITRLVYGADDPKAGAAGSVIDIINSEHFNHQPEVRRGVLAEECAGLLKEFFKERR